MHKFIKLSNGNTVHHLHFGKGDPLILVPSLWVTSRSYRTLGEKLGKHFEVFIPDLFKGKSVFSNKAHEVDDYVSELKNFIDQLKLKDYYLVGVSLSGIIVKRLVFNYNYKPKKIFLISTTVLPLGIKHQKTSFILGYIKLLYHNMFSHKGLTKNMMWIVDGLTYAFRHFQQFILEGRMAVSISVKKVTEIPVPTKLIFTLRDEYMPSKIVHDLEKVKNMEVEMVDEYHGWFFGEEDVLVGKIKDYFN